jgi:replicative DNA helicase
MKLLSPQSELKAIKTICGDYNTLASMLLGSCSPESFYYKPTSEAYRVIVARLRENGSIPDWSEVVNDLSIGQSSRKILMTTKEVAAVSKEKVASIVSTLEKYRKLRGVVQMAQNVLDKIEDDKLDLDELLDTASDELAKARTRGDAKTRMYHIGKNNNSTALVRESLYGKAKPSVPTGFRAFDERNGGILLGSLWTIGANTGGGKTTMAINVLRNMTEFAAEDCCIVPLEMTATQTTDRLWGVLTGLDVNKISQKRLSAGEKKLIKKAYKNYVTKLKELNTRYSIYEPEEDLTIEEVLLTLKPYKYKVILIDYISLLKGADGDDQWRQLGNIARFAKMFAKTNNCIVVLLCQVSEEGKIRYAQAIAEHSNNAWIWTMTGEESDTSIMDVKQIKARNQHRFSFQLLSHNASMLVTDIDDLADPSEENDDENKGKSERKEASEKEKAGGRRRKDGYNVQGEDDSYLVDANEAGDGDGEDGEDE